MHRTHSGRNRPWLANVLGGGNDKVVKAIVILFEDGEKLGAHTRLPEVVYMVGNPGDRLVLRLRVEESRNLVGHVDQFLCRRFMTFTIHIAPIELWDFE